jgi:RNA polymerase sigma-70 factor (ECF subfamily)
VTDGGGRDQFRGVGSLDRSDAAPAAHVPGLRELFEMHASYVWNTLRRLGVPASDLEDRTHDVFVQIHGHLHAYDAARPVRPWLFGFAFRIASQERRRAHRRHEIQGEPADAVDPAALPDAQVAKERDRRLVLDALEGIALDRRAVFVLYELDGVPMEEIARSLGIPLNTGYSRLRTARAEFAAAVRRLRPPRRGGEP